MADSTELDWTLINRMREQFDKAERRKQELREEGDRLWAQLERLGRRSKLLRRI